MQSLDIIVCTYAPDRLALRRLSDALIRLQKPDSWIITFTLVDNNSPEPVAKYSEILALLRHFDEGQCLVEEHQGVAFARQLGIAKTKSPWILYFDDDNEPQENYLLEVVNHINAFPNVGMWGAGKVDVVYTEPPKDPYVLNYHTLLGERHQHHLEFACLRGGWYSAYPGAMGMAIRRDIVMAYLEGAQQGKLTAVGRIGRQVLSGEDAQMVFQGISMGFAAGRAPTLAFNHLIVVRKSTFDYLVQIAYGNSVSYAKAYFESYGEHIPNIYLPTNQTILVRISKIVLKGLWNRKYRSLKVELAGYLGVTEGNFCAKKLPTPWPLAFLKRKLGITS